MEGFTIQTKTTSRRAVLAGIATAPALAGPAMAGDDAELVRLGRELADLIPEHAAARAESAELHEALNLAIDYHLGLPEKRKRFEQLEQVRPDDKDAMGRRLVDVYYEEITLPRSKEWDEAMEAPDSKPYRSERHQWDAAYGRWNDLADRGSELTDAIYRLPARTLAGLGVKALAVVFAMNREDDEMWWDKEEEASKQPDPEEAAIYLVKAVIEFAGITIPSPKAAS
jgi:hypothetical protein